MIADNQSEIQIRNRATIADLERIRYTRRHFPPQDSLTVAAISSRSADALVDSDFLAELNEVGCDLTIDHIGINMLIPEELTREFTEATGNILVIIRAGGETRRYVTRNRGSDSATK